MIPVVLVEVVLCVLPMVGLHQVRADLTPQMCKSYSKQLITAFANLSVLNLRLTSLMLTLLMVTGCATSSITALQSTAPGGYESLEMTYEVEGHSNRLGARLAKARSKPDETLDPSLNNEFTHTRISIQYPHPEKGPQQAEVKLLVSRHAPETMPKGWVYQLRETVAQAANRPMRMAGLSSQFGSSEAEIDEQEVWTMDLPKSELDLLVSDLSESGFFSDQLRPKGAVALTCKTDGKVVSKRWSSESRLEEFINRTYTQGTLAGFERTDSDFAIQQVSFEEQAPPIPEGFEI